MAGRVEGKQESSAPGPGAYSHDSTVGKSGPAFSISGRMQRPLSAGAPGPGAYSQDSTLGKGPAFSLSGRTDQRMESDARMNSASCFLYFFCRLLTSF